MMIPESMLSKRPLLCFSSLRETSFSADLFAVSGASTEDEEPTVSRKLPQLMIDDVPSNVLRTHGRRYRE